MTTFRLKTIALLSALLLSWLISLAPPQQAKETFLYPIEKDDKWGFIDQTGKIVIPPQFDTVSSFQDGLAQVIQQRKVAFIDTAGKIVLRPDFEIVRDFSEGFAAVNNGEKRNPIVGIILEPGRWGYIDKTGKLALPMRFTHAEAFSEGLAAVELDKHTGFIDRTGKMVLEVPLDVTLDFSEGIVGVLRSGRISYWDRTGTKLNTPPLDADSSYHSFSEGLATIATNGKSGYIDKTGKLVIPAEYEDAEDFSEGLAAAQVTGEMRWCPQENGSRYGSSKSFGYIDKTGKMIIAPKFDYASPFREGLASVSICSKRGFIDKTGKVVIALQFLEAFSFRGGLAQVRNSPRGPFTYIDKTGKIVWAPSK